MCSFALRPSALSLFLSQLHTQTHLLPPVFFLSCCHPLPVEHHECRVQGDGQQEVTDDDIAQGVDGGERPDLPIVGEDVVRADDERRHQEAEDEGALEPLEQPRDLLDEVDLLELLGRGTPRHVNGEEVREQRLRNVQREAAEEDGHERNPLEVFELCTKK